MTFRFAWVLMSLVAWSAPAALAGERGSPAEKKVLLELFTSQGCDSCPAAERLLGQLRELGYPTEQIIPIVFHVDYFNDPWKDPFSSSLFSRREYQYSLIYQRENKIENPNYLYFTPMLIVDGRYPMLGSDKVKLSDAVKRALADKPEIALDLSFQEGQDTRRKTLRVELTSPSPRLAGREVLVGAVITQDSVTTKVGSGENGGKTLVEHFPVRSLKVQAAKLERSGATVLRFSLAVEEEWDPSASGVAVFVQDENSGRIYQAESVRWQGKSADPGSVRRTNAAKGDSRRKLRSSD
jgi:hypothetical protein